MEGMDNTRPRQMSYKLLKEITGDFSKDNYLGQGGFGVVYKGVDKDGQEIAVKLLHSMDLDDKNFCKEFDNIRMLKHSNIVEFVGFCCEEEEEHIEHNGKYITAVRLHRALCFEYMHNGSLKQYISDEHQGLTWQARYRIIKGICEGLKYLHTGLASPICHLDLKPENILLDKKMMPKIADFGLSRLIGEENTKRTANLIGTLKFMPPEFIMYNITSKEYDIYSLGVLIIMIMVGSAVYSLIDIMKPTEFVELVHKKWRERLQEKPGCMSLEEDCEQVKKCIEIASTCVQKKKHRRPCIEQIVDLLSQTEKHRNDLTPEIEKVITVKHDSTKRRLDRKPSLSLMDIPLSFLKEITGYFSTDQEIGKGVYGTIYKGVLPVPDREVISVKKLNENLPIPQKRAFTNEVLNLTEIDHENIVTLVGFCHGIERKVALHNGRYVIVDFESNLICYEYLDLGSLDKYIYSDSNRAIDWDTRFNIIMGICKGLHFLHMELDTPLIHMDIKSENILLDYNWVPKIANFHFSRQWLLEGDWKTFDIVGSVGYKPPEYLSRGEFSTMTDIYSLGLLIIEIMTGEKVNCNNEDMCGNKFIEKVRQVLTEDYHPEFKYSLLDANDREKAKACIKMGLQCVQYDRRYRPSIVEIINKLNVIKKIKPVISTGLFYVYPRQLHFAFTPNKSISRLLQLKNISHDCIAVRLQTSKGSKRYYYKMPLFGIVPPLSVCTLIVTRREQKASPNNESLTLESMIVHEGDLSMKLNDTYIAIIEYENIFKRARKADANHVHELTLPVICDPPGDATSSQRGQEEVEIISNDFAHVLSVDVHPTKPWIMTSHYGGKVVIWNYKKQETENIFKITTEPVYSTKFVERELWLVAGDGDGNIYVYNYYHPESEARRIEEAHDSDIRSLDVHPTEHFVLSSSDDQLIKLWDWEKDWECIRTFEGHSDRVTQVNFFPTDPNSFASASLDNTIRIWNIKSSESKITLSDRPDGLLCMHNYIIDNRKYLLSGFVDGSAQVWDVEEERCVQTFEGHLNRVSSVCSHPEHGVLITGSYDGTVRIWDSTTYRLENNIGLNLGAVYALGYNKSIKRVVIVCCQGIVIVE